MAERNEHGPGRSDAGRGAVDPPELQAILLPIKDGALRERIARAYYILTEGDPSGITVQLSVFLSGLAYAIQQSGNGQAGAKAGQPLTSNQLEALQRDIAGRLEQAFRDADDNRHRQTDEIKRAIREAQPPQRWYKRADWLAALAMLLFATGFVGGFWITWPLAKDRAHAEAMARISALTSTLKGH